METEIYEGRAKELIAQIRELIDVKGVNLDEALAHAGVSAKDAKDVLQHGKLPSLTTFLALCEISGITLHLPSIETPNTHL